MSAMLEAMKKAGLVSEEKAKQAERENEKRAAFDKQQKEKQQRLAAEGHAALRSGDLNTFLDKGTDFILEGAKRLVGPDKTVK